MCTQAADQPAQNIRAETYGPGSRCVEHGRQWFLTTNEASSTSQVYGGGCYQVWLCIYTYLTLNLPYFTIDQKIVICILLTISLRQQSLMKLWFTNKLPFTSYNILNLTAIPEGKGLSNFISWYEVDRRRTWGLVPNLKSFSY